MASRILPIFQAKWPESLDPHSKPLLEKVALIFQKALHKAPTKPSQPVLGGDRIQFKTPDGTLVEGTFFEKKGSNRAIAIPLSGNEEQWIKRLKPIGCSILLVDASDRSALAFYSALSYLYEGKGLNPQFVLPLGFSQRGAIATKGAILAQECYPEKPIPCLSLCSFWASKFETLQGKTAVLFRPDDEKIPYPFSMARGVLDPQSTRVIELLRDQSHEALFTKKEIATLQYEIRKCLNLRQPLFRRIPFKPEKRLYDIQSIAEEFFEKMSGERASFKILVSDKTSIAAMHSKTKTILLHPNLIFKEDRHFKPSRLAKALRAEPKMHQRALRAIIAHELAHHYLGHQGSNWYKTATNCSIFPIALVIGSYLSILPFTIALIAIHKCASRVFRALYQLSHRHHEYEADLAAAKVTKDPVALQYFLAKAVPYAKRFSFSHPKPKDRIHYLREHYA